MCLAKGPTHYPPLASPIHYLHVLQGARASRLQAPSTAHRHHWPPEAAHASSSTITRPVYTQVPPLTSSRKLSVKFRPSKKALGKLAEGPGVDAERAAAVASGSEAGSVGCCPHGEPSGLSCELCVSCFAGPRGEGPIG